MLDPFERMRYVKSIIQMIYPKVTHEEIKSHLLHITKYHKKERKMLSEQERVIADLMLQHRIRPSTAYIWYKVLNLPEYIQCEIRDRKISMTEAFQKNLESNKPFQVIGEELDQEIQGYVGELAKRDFLRGDDYAIQ